MYPLLCLTLSRVVGVFETVGNLGLPQEINLHPNMKNIFGFNDRLLGEHVQNAFQALALNEPRADFVRQRSCCYEQVLTSSQACCKFEQTPAGAQKGQKLSQCWFAGAHTDVGECRDWFSGKFLPSFSTQEVDTRPTILRTSPSSG